MDKLEFESSNEEVEVLEINDSNQKQDERKKTNTGLVMGIIILILIISSLVYYFLIRNNVQNKFLKNKIKVASTDYFEKYMSTNDSASTYVVTLDMLRNANNQGEKYDLNGLEKCSKQSTQARITIDYNNGKPKKVEVELNC